jgi:hypothetical protein
VVVRKPPRRAWRGVDCRSASTGEDTRLLATGKKFSNPSAVSLGVVCAGGCAAISFGEIFVRWSMLGRVLLTLATIASAFFAVRIGRSGICIDTDSVEVRGWAERGGLRGPTFQLSSRYQRVL